MFGKEKITKTVHIEGMSCMHCASSVEKALLSLSGVLDVNVDLDAKAATVKLKKEVSDTDIKTAVEKAGFIVTEIE